VRNHLCPPILGGTLNSSFPIELDHLVPAPLTAALGRRSSTDRTNSISSTASFLPKRRALIADSFDQPLCTRRTYVATACLVIPRNLILETSLPKYCVICPSMLSFIIQLAIVSTAKQLPLVRGSARPTLFVAASHGSSIAFNRGLHRSCRFPSTLSARPVRHGAC